VRLSGDSGQVVEARGYHGRFRTFWSTPAPTICWSKQRNDIRAAGTYRLQSGHRWCVPMARPGAHAPSSTR